nr:hypothetical protein [Streptomyces antimycoticus]
MTALVFPVAGLLALTTGGHLLLPFDGVTTLEGKIASKSEFFEDEKVQRLLMKHGIRVHITRMGSRFRGRRSVSCARRTGCATTPATRARSRRAAWARCATGTPGPVN